MNFCAAGFLMCFHSRHLSFPPLGHVTEHRVTEYFCGWSVKELVARCTSVALLLSALSSEYKHVCFPLNPNLNDRHLLAMLSLADKFIL